MYKSSNLKKHLG